MTVTETPVIEHLAVQLWDLTAGAWRSESSATRVSIKRGTRDGASMSVGAATLELLGDHDLAYDLAYRPNTPVRVVGLAAGDRLYTGMIANAYAAQSSDGTRRTTITAVDGVQALANTSRYGAVADTGLGYETWRSRILRLCASSPVPTQPPLATGTPKAASILGLGAITPLLWNASISTNTQTDSGYVRMTRFGATSPSSIAAGAGYATLTLRDLVPGRVYTIGASLRVVRELGNTGTGHTQHRLRVVGRAVSDAFVASATQDTPSPMLEFTASATSHVLRFENVTALTSSLVGSIRFSISAVAFAEVEGADDYQLQDVELEASLATHFDVACDTVGARWWLDSDGVVQFRRGARDEALVATFTDEHLVSASVGFDTQTAVNVLDIENLGRAPSASRPGEWDSTRTARTAQYPSSITRWGPRAGSLRTSMYLGIGHTTDLERRAADEFERRSRPAYAITAARWNAQQRPDLAARLELLDRVRVERGGVRQSCRIAQLTHTITPTRWMVDMTFTDIRAGITFAEYNARLGAQTFQQLNAEHAGQTFAQYNRSINQETTS